MEKLLKFGVIKDGSLKSINEVDNGLSCGCTCPGCGYQLVAKNNELNKKEKHFAHASGKECIGAVESAIHLLAKRVLQRTKTLYLPDFHYDYNPLNKHSIFKKGNLEKFDSISLEQRVVVNGKMIIPDAIGIINGVELYIEFANTHFVDDDKKILLKKAKKPCIELDIRLLDQDEFKIEDFLSTHYPLTKSKLWILNPLQEKKYKQKLELKKAEELAEKRKNDQKYWAYKKDLMVNVYKVNRFDSVNNCPLKLLELAVFKEESQKENSFYRHSVIKRILDGESWNGEFYGYRPNGNSIYIGNGREKEKIIIFPPEAENPTDEEIVHSKFLYAGLKLIAEKLSKFSQNTCNGCKYAVDKVSTDYGDFQVCNFKNPNK